MKQSKLIINFILGLNIHNKKYYNNTYYEKYYNVNYQRHGLYSSAFFINNINYYYKGYYYMNLEYSHWLDYNQHFKYRYYI